MQLGVVGGRDEECGAQIDAERIYENIIVGASQHIKKSVRFDAGPLEVLIKEVVEGTPKLIPSINIVKCIKLVLRMIATGLLFKHSVIPPENQPKLVVPSERFPSSLEIISIHKYIPHPSRKQRDVPHTIENNRLPR